MPTYEYVCTACGNQWEEIQKISEPALTDCPKCLAASAKRQISGGNFILKGGGWYADLYSSTKPKSGGGEAKTETKSTPASDAPSSPSGASGGASSGAAAPAAPAAPAAAPSTSTPTKSS